MKPEVKVILEKAQAGDEEAFNQLYRLYYQSTFIKANNICKNDADAKDATQATFIEVYRSLKNLRDLDYFYSWLMVVVTSKCNLIFRKQKYALYDIDDYENNSKYVEERVYMDPTLYTDNELEFETLLHIIDSLDDRKAQVLKMVFLQEMKLSEIAEELDIPLGTVKTRAVRAKAELKKKLEEYEAVEHRKLHFHVDAIIPTTLLAVASKGGIFSMFTQKIKHGKEFVSTHVVTTACAVSIAGLSVSGGALLIDDVRNAKEASTTSQQVEKETSAKEEPQTSVSKGSFKPISYQEETIQNSREAYYICVNFAKNEEIMKTRTKEDFQEVIPIYEELKVSNSNYYEMLKKSGWSIQFEQYAY